MADGGVDTGKKRARFAPGHERVPGAQSMARPEAIDFATRCWIRQTAGRKDLVAAGCRTRDRRAGSKCQTSGSNQPKKSVWDPHPAQSSVSSHPSRPRKPNEDTGLSSLAVFVRPSRRTNPLVVLQSHHGSQTTVLESNYKFSASLLEPQKRLSLVHMDPQFPHVSSVSVSELQGGHQSRRSGMLPHRQADRAQMQRRRLKPKTTGRAQLTRCSY